MTAFDLWLQDCVKGMSKLPKASVDLVVTSPPYNLGIKYGRYSDTRDRSSYLDWCKQWAAEVRRILRPDGSFFLNIGSTPSNPMLPHELAMQFRDLFVLQNTIHWIKSIAIDTIGKKARHDEPEFNLFSLEEKTAKRSLSAKARDSATSYGHFKPINSKRFLNDCHEYIFHFTKTGSLEIDRLALGVPYQDKSNIARWSHTRGSDRRCRGNTWFVPYETIQSREKERPHP